MLTMNDVVLVDLLLFRSQDIIQTLQGRVSYSITLSNTFFLSCLSFFVSFVTLKQVDMMMNKKFINLLSGVNNLYTSTSGEAK